MLANTYKSFILVILALTWLTQSTKAQIVAEPNEVTTLYLVCLVGQVVVPNCNVSATITAVDFTGGHYHTGSPRYGNPRQGFLNPSSGNTGAQGFVQTQYSATRIAQAERVRTCISNTTNCTDTDIQVRRPNLVELWAGWAHVMVGSTSSHIFNHFVTVATRDKTLAIVAQYANEFSGVPGYTEPWEPVGVNDSSLPTGGVFDICATLSSCSSTAQNPSGGANPWSGPHQSSSHDNGDAVDFRANSSPNNIINSLAVKDRFRAICAIHGLATTFHESIGLTNEHIHCAAY